MNQCTVSEKVSCIDLILCYAFGFGFLRLGDGMKRCPVCSVNVWSDTTFGYQKCPNCKGSFLVGKQTIERDKRHNRKFVANVHQPSRDSIPVNNTVICACCQRPYPPSQCTDGVIEGDGVKMVQVQVGWTFSDATGDFVPATENRFIPRRIRGLLCHECYVDYGGRRIGDSDLRESRRKVERQRIESPMSDVRGGKLFYPTPLDPDPTWAHTGNHAWLSGGSTTSIKDAKTGTVRASVVRGKHPNICPCYECLHRKLVIDPYNPIDHIHRMILRGPYALTKQQPDRPLTVTLPWARNVRPRSANRVVAGHSRRERVGRCLTIPDTLVAAVKAAIAQGDSTGAYLYARMAARHPAAQRVRKA